MPESSTASDELQASYDEAFEREREGGFFYAPFDQQPALIEAAHYRRMALLDSIDLGDLSGATCADYGCGSWGFAAVFPKLHDCREAVGLDISNVALAESERRQRESPHPTRPITRFVQSAGDQLALEDSSVDVFFAGESIEHVALTRPFIDEVHRVLRSGGRFVLTTPNSDALTYRATGRKFASGPEHVALMNYDELLGYLEPAFQVETELGFNASYLPASDFNIRDKGAVASWCEAFQFVPRDATCVIVGARRRDDYDRSQWKSTTYHHSDERWQFSSEWQPTALHARMTGRAAGGVGQSATLDFEGNGLSLLLWSHPWSGIAKILIDGEPVDEVDLLAPEGGGFVRVDRYDLGSSSHRVEIRVTGRAHPHSLGTQVILHQAASYDAGHPPRST